MTKHTPGPWEWDVGLCPPDGPERYADIHKDGGDLIIASFNDLIPEGRANARLIAAAPELLAALKALIPTNINLDHAGWGDGTVLPCDVTLGELRAAAAAIAKAEAPTQDAA